MELEDSYFPHMGEVTFTDNFEEASKDGDWFCLLEVSQEELSLTAKK